MTRKFFRLLNVSNLNLLSSAGNLSSFSWFSNYHCFKTIVINSGDILSGDRTDINKNRFEIRLKSYENAPLSSIEEGVSDRMFNNEIISRRMKHEKNSEILSFLEEFSQKESYCNSDWEKLKILVLSGGKNLKVNNKNVETLIMKYMASCGYLNLARSYYFYLKNSNSSINLVTSAVFLHILYNCWDDHIPEDVNTVETICNHLLKMPLLECKVTEALISGLCLTNRWKESFKVIEKFKDFYDVTPKCYSVIIKTAFQNKDTDLAVKLLDEKLSLNFKMNQSVYETWLETSVDKKSAIRSLLKFLSKHNEVLYFDNGKRLLNIILKEQKIPKGVLPATLTDVSNKGICRCCKNTLKDATLTKGEFEKLRSSFVDSLILGRDIFIKTNPTELDEFLKFLQKTAPYDFVLDGLNIAYAVGFKNTSSDEFANNLRTVVKHLVERKKRILILGRKHMQSWPKVSMNYIKKNADLFLIDNISEDDPYLLYATLFSGEKTFFMSRDLMRGHKYLLSLRDHELNSIFWRWQCTHQYVLLNVLRDGTLILKDPVMHLQSAHKVTSNYNSKGRWHVPCKPLDESYTPGHKKFNLKCWLCIPEL